MITGIVRGPRGEIPGGRRLRCGPFRRGGIPDDPEAPPTRRPLRGVCGMVRLSGGATLAKRRLPSGPAPEPFSTARVRAAADRDGQGGRRLPRPDRPAPDASGRRNAVRHAWGGPHTLSIRRLASGVPPTRFHADRRDERPGTREGSANRAAGAPANILGPRSSLPEKRGRDLFARPPFVTDGRSCATHRKTAARCRLRPRLGSAARRPSSGSFRRSP